MSLHQKFQKILTDLSKFHFVNLDKVGFTYGPQGILLARNIENLWFRHCITMPTCNIFPTASDKLTDTVNYIKKIQVDQLPFGFAVLETTKSKCNQVFFTLESNTYMLQKIAKVIIFNDANSIKNTFQTKQRERKVWWRKLAYDPSRFMLTEVKKSKKEDVVDIQVQFSFGNILIETIKLHHDVNKYFSQDVWDKLNVSDVKAVEHLTLLDWGCLALLCDGCREINKDTRLQIHPKIAPYKTSFVAVIHDDDTDSIKEDLKQLILYLNNLLRLSGINTVLSNNKQSLSAFQVPFIVNVDKISLKNGIVHVTSQLTTLVESVHITGLVEHIASRCS